MQNKDFVRITYNGKLKETGQEFDRGDKVPVIIGEQFVIPGVDDALKEMNVGDKKTVEIQPDRGFGSRKPELIKLVPQSEFKKHNTKPVPGMTVNADNRRGRVLSVSSGRVKVDFNHPLAGKVIVYDIEVNEKIDDVSEKVKALVQFYTKMTPDKSTVELKEDQVDITVPPTIHPAFKNKMATDIEKYLGIKKTRFIEVFEKGQDSKE